ncbi:hypothetical protein RB200_02660 [Streptomyces sp. PmtG]
MSWTLLPPSLNVCRERTARTQVPSGRSAVGAAPRAVRLWPSSPSKASSPRMPGPLSSCQAPQQ